MFWLDCLEASICDEGRVVTYKHLSNLLQVQANEAKRYFSLSLSLSSLPSSSLTRTSSMLSEFAAKKGDAVCVLYYVDGVKDGEFRVEICSSGKLRGVCVHCLSLPSFTGISRLASFSLSLARACFFRRPSLP